MEKVINGNRIELLDYLRGIMAFSVLIFHYSLWSEISYFYPLDKLVPRLGIYAVSSFYVISGASLAIVYYNKHVNVGFLREFFIKRIFRIAPLFYVATTLTILLAVASSFVNNDFTKVPTIESIALNYSMLFGWVSPSSYIATGAWSIGNELVFYSLFPIMLFLMNKSLKQYVVFFVAAILISLFISLSIINPQHTIEDQWSYYINPLNQVYLFAGGFLIGSLLKMGKVINRKFLLIIIIISAILFVFLPTKGLNQVTLVTGYPKILLSAAVFSFCLFATFWGDTKKNVFNKILKFLGDISYSVYLIHPIVYVSLGIIFRRISISSIAAHVMLSIAITIVASTLIYRYFEQPLMSIGKSISMKKNTQKYVAKQSS